MDPFSENHLSSLAPFGTKVVGGSFTRPDRIVDIMRQCFAFFGRARSGRIHDVRTETEIDNQLSRFKGWAGTIGVFAAGNTSTDARLKNDDDVKEIMIDMLFRLRKALDRFTKATITEEAEDEDSFELSDSSDDSEASLVLSISDESDEGVSDVKTSSYQDPSLQEIDAVISKLYRFSAIIRKPVSLQETARVANFIEKAEEPPDAAEFQSHVRWQIKFRLPDASENIVNRLVNAVVFRRRKLQYRARHQMKLSQGVEGAFQEEVLLPMTPQQPQPSKILNQRRNLPFLTAAASVRSSSNTTPFSATEASTVNRRALASYPKSLAGGSNFTKLAVARRDQLDVPLPPKVKETEEAICPYCFEVVDKAKMVRSLWTRHILRDIDPYVCLFEDCSRPNEQFQSFDDWIIHMKWQHTLVWSCQTPHHKDFLFDTSTDCEDHMRQEHSKEFSTSQLALLVEKSAQPAADPLAVICRGNGSEADEKLTCPLCPFSVNTTRIPEPNVRIHDAGVVANDFKEMRDRITTHLESIALLSLPEQEDIDDAASDEVQSQSAKMSSRGENLDQEELFLTSDAWDEYNRISLHDYVINSTGTEYCEDINLHCVFLVDTAYEDWVHITSMIRFRTPHLNPGQDPVLIPVVERARQIQTVELQKRLGISLIVITNPDGLEVPERWWSEDIGQLQADLNDTALWCFVNPSPQSKEHVRSEHEKYSDFFKVPDEVLRTEDRSSDFNEIPTLPYDFDMSTVSRSSAPLIVLSEPTPAPEPEISAEDEGE